jgi:hypothetical protein
MRENSLVPDLPAAKRSSHLSFGWSVSLKRDAVVAATVGYFSSYGRRASEPEPSPTRESPNAQRLQIPCTLDVGGVAVSSPLEISVGERVRQSRVSTEIHMELTYDTSNPVDGPRLDQAARRQIDDDWLGLTNALEFEQMLSVTTGPAQHPIRLSPEFEL